MKSKWHIILPVLLFITIIIAGCKNHSASSLISPVAPSPASLQKLMDGNSRFAHWQPIHPDESRQRVIEISRAQYPFAVVIACSDSRVSPELIFDQGLGDLFVIRTAGNLIGGLEIGSVEYAVEHLGVDLIVVLGHQQCGAVKAFVGGGEVHGHIKDIIDSLKNEKEISNVSLNDKNRLDDCIRANILHGIHQLKEQSAIIKEKLDSKQLQIRACYYDLEKGIVSIVKE
jgi:carbonic anhydrase